PPFCGPRTLCHLALLPSAVRLAVTDRSIPGPCLSFFAEGNLYSPGAADMSHHHLIISQRVCDQYPLDQKYP
ncbi:uncharacterized protein EV420DRAFT_1560181, partial [Desarmillaria tabescens]